MIQREMRNSKFEMRNAKCDTASVMRCSLKVHWNNSEIVCWTSKPVARLKLLHDLTVKHSATC